MVYTLLRPAARLALRLYYRNIEGVGLDRIPSSGPTILVVNHPNALVDALVVGTLVKRRVFMTAKATLFGNPVLARFLRAGGVIPLRRAKDERAAGAVDPDRNVAAFQAIHEALKGGAALLIFPEGISHDEPSLAPLRTGAARMALQARDEIGIRGLSVVPIGLTFSRKDAPRSRVLAEVGDPIMMDSWEPSAPDSQVAELTAEIERRLRAVTLNFASMDEAERSMALAGAVARLLALEAPSLDAGGPRLSEASAIARRIDRYRAGLQFAEPDLRERVDRFVEHLERFRALLDREGVRPEDLAIARDIRSGARFIAREGRILLLAGPVSVWGNVNHWLPFRASRAIAMRSVSSAADPAMRTIVAGAALVLLAYAVQGAVAARLLGGAGAALYLASLPLAAEINLRFRERLRRAARRARAYIRFRRDPALHASLMADAAALRAEALELDRMLARDN